LHQGLGGVGVLVLFGLAVDEAVRVAVGVAVDDCGPAALLTGAGRDAKAAPGRQIRPHAAVRYGMRTELGKSLLFVVTFEGVARRLGMVSGRGCLCWPSDCCS
jgi:hypothetical protein